MKTFVDAPAESSPIGRAVDGFWPAEQPAGPLQTEIIRPLVAIAGQITLLREGRLGPLTFEQRQALNVIHGRLSSVALALQEMEQRPPAVVPDAVAEVTTGQ